MKATFVSGIFAIFANVALGLLSSKYGVTKPLHEAGASVITANVAFAVLTDYPSFSTAWRLFYIICAIPITKSIWKAALYLAGWARSDNREAKLPTCVGESKGLCSVTKDVNDDMYKEKPLAP
ncbi:hypothetical protein DFH06DRAFT_1479877 [Mycena polygramma]|nr:hypothetical protein DFH06DRAFT_1479877 [Mycena polygramma]